MGVSAERATIDWLGLNHLGFAVRIIVDGRDETEQAIEAVADHWAVDGNWIRTLGVIPASYLQYYYHHEKLLETYLQPDPRTRGEVVQEIEADLLRRYADPELDTKPDLLQKRGGGGYADVAFTTMQAIAHNTGDRQIVQVLNQGALDGLPDDASVEIPCVLDQTGPHPIRIGEIPLQVRGLIQMVKTYEQLTVDAAVQGSRSIALQALMAHPLTPDWKTTSALLDELLAANQTWISWAS
jgi:6-phospho-beta-glucosidase